jgi:hypothetical protein
MEKRLINKQVPARSVQRVDIIVTVGAVKLASRVGLPLAQVRAPAIPPPWVTTLPSAELQRARRVQVTCTNRRLVKLIVKRASWVRSQMATPLTACSALLGWQQCGESRFAHLSMACQRQMRRCSLRVMLRRSAVRPIVARMPSAAQQLSKSLKSSPAHLVLLHRVLYYPKVWRTCAKIAHPDTTRTLLDSTCASQPPEAT